MGEGKLSICLYVLGAVLLKKLRKKGTGKR